MLRAMRRGPSPAKLRWFLGILFFALAVPTAVLIVQTDRQMKWEAVAQYRDLAEELAARIDADLLRLIAVEEARSYGDYQFIVVSGNPSTNVLQRSPLARYPVESEIPGLIGYFQVDSEGVFSTPLLPDDPADGSTAGLDSAELSARRALSARLFDVLGKNHLVDRRRPIDEVPPPPSARPMPAPLRALSRMSRAPAAASGAPKPLPADQMDFDQLVGPSSSKSASKDKAHLRVDDLPLDKTYQEKKSRPITGGYVAPEPKENVVSRVARKEVSSVLETPRSDEPPSAAPGRVHTFESEIDPFEFSLLETGHGVLFRKVWRNGKRTIQGAILDQEAFLRGAMAKPFEKSTLWQMSRQLVAYQGNVLGVTAGAGGHATFSSRGAVDAKGELLHQVHLAAPLGGFQLLWTIDDLPPGPGARIVTWTSMVLFAVLVLGFVALYRLGLRQLLLARQKQDFVSAVSHELKTPLTSIRMYAEMLQAGWATDEKKREYYDYIHGESERLSRLIANVLQLARMERNDLQLDAKPATVGALVDVLRSKVESQITRAGFECSYTVEPAAAEREVVVDMDAFVQILINLIDNAIKFSAKAERRAIEITVHATTRAVIFGVRDHGPGVHRSQMKKIFELFYRSGNELTRDTVGTGIGLALVRQLALAMGGDVDVLNRDPGAEFLVTLPSQPNPG